MRSHDPDDQYNRPAPRAPRGAAPTPPAVAPAPAGANRAFGWGKVAVNEPGQLSDLHGSTGVVRRPAPSVRYRPPPLGGPTWNEVASGGRRFEMPLDDATVRQAVTLEEWRRGLAQRPPTGQGAEDLRRRAQLDSLAHELLAVTEALHANDWRLGLLDPGNLLIVPAGDAVRLILPDLGFTWEGPLGPPPWADDLTRPNWVRPGGRFDALWDLEPAWQQFAAPDDWPRVPEFGGPDGRAAAHQADLRLLARLMAFAIDGQVGKDPASDNRAPVWRVLRAAAAGRLASAAEFRQALRNAPLSEHFAPPPRNGGGSGPPRVLPLVAAVVVLAAAGVGVWFYLEREGLNRPEVVDKQQPGKEDIKPDPGQVKSKDGGGGPPLVPPSPEVAALEGRMKDMTFVEKVEELKPAFDRAGASGPDREWLDDYRRGLRADWLGRFREACEKGTQPGDELQLARSAYRLRRELVALQQLPATDEARTEEQRWLDFCDQLIPRPSPPGR